MSALSDVFQYVDSLPPVVKRLDSDYTVGDIILALSTEGVDVPERTLRRQISGIKLQRNSRGYFGKAEVAVLVGWLRRRNLYNSYKDYLASEGQAIYDHATQLFAS